MSIFLFPTCITLRPNTGFLTLRISNVFLFLKSQNEDPDITFPNMPSESDYRFCRSCEIQVESIYNNPL